MIYDCNKTKQLMHRQWDFHFTIPLISLEELRTESKIKSRPIEERRKQFLPSDKNPQIRARIEGKNRKIYNESKWPMKNQPENERRKPK